MCGIAGFFSLSAAQSAGEELCMYTSPRELVERSKSGFGIPGCGGRFVAGRMLCWMSRD